ncbi:MAG TPA: signal peptidase I [Candidatus Saccharibacteria bacterium]|nr:signal peptidase I [Candidatus Saccharibacteria bacterium]
MNDEHFSHDQGIQPTGGKKTKKDTAKAISGTLAMFLLAPVIALFLVAFVFQSYRVDGASMESTLSNNDRLIVSKVPKTWSKITKEPYIPARYDIIVFQKSESFGLKEYDKIQLIKRVIALPGEKVVIKNGVVTVYTSEQPEGFNVDEGQDYASNIGNTGGEVNVKVENDEVFVLGDNRNNSLDSRVFGPINSNNIIGKLAFRIYPL